jgi:hypothetical protein
MLVRDKNTCFVYEAALLSRVAIASLISLAVWYNPLRIHKLSGQRNPRFVCLLVLSIVANAVAALLQIGGAIVLYSLSLANKKMSTHIRHGILLVRLKLPK